jgi:hypothetical protein
VRGPGATALPNKAEQQERQLRVISSLSHCEINFASFVGWSWDAALGPLVRDIDCKVIVLTQQDGAWSRDLFAASALFTLIEEAEGKWRICRASR